MKISDYPDLISDDEFSFLIAADWLEEQNRNYEAECLRQGHVFSVWLYFLTVNFNCTLGYGHGTGDDYGDGDGFGDGTGYGDGDGYGAGYDYGDDYGSGAGYGTGHDFDKVLLMFFASISQNVSKS
jgi:hypothetical protein